jgi:hypothetical protein
MSSHVMTGLPMPAVVQIEQPWAAGRRSPCGFAG